MIAKNKIHIICGPTASGKSAIALERAHEKDGVIINCDSLQIYDGLPILTAQPSESDYQAAPHLLYAHRHPNDVCSAGSWCDLVIPLITSILEAGQTPIICGGTGLYIKALTVGLSPIPDIPPEIRAEIIQRYENLGPEGFYDVLRQKDPEMAARFHINHKARLIRAMEVLEATGKSLAEWQKIERSAPPESWDFEFEVILPDRDVLYHRCNTRFEAMLEAGALQEAADFEKKIAAGAIKQDVPLTKALGFHELLCHIKGIIQLDEAIILAQAATRRYAKRQVTWFRNQIKLKQ